MNDITTLTGVVATVPNHLVTGDGLAITSFRLASGQRRFDRATNTWVDADTNWYTVSTFRRLAFNVSRSIRKGEHVVVTGRLRIRNWENQERKGTSIDLEADAVGHNLLWCTTSCVRNVAPGPVGLQHAEQLDPDDPERLGSDGSDGLGRADRVGDDQPSDGFLPEETLGLAIVDS